MVKRDLDARIEKQLRYQRKKVKKREAKEIIKNAAKAKEKK